MYEINSDNLSRSLEIKIWAHKFIWSIEKTNGKKHRGPSMMSTIGMRFPLLEVEYIPEVLPNLMNPEVLPNLMNPEVLPNLMNPEVLPNLMNPEVLANLMNPEVFQNLMNPEVLANLMKRVNHTDDKKFKKLNNLVFTKDKKEKYAQKVLNNRRRK